LARSYRSAALPAARLQTFALATAAAPTATDSADEMLARFARQPPAPGDIILLHEEHRHTLDALPLVIEGLCSHGFDPVTISDLFR
jgi:peptidoglycan/xylan/chitin deacetylase (PgdA/CDA1 family)